MNGIAFAGRPKISVGNTGYIKTTIDAAMNKLIGFGIFLLI